MASNSMEWYLDKVLFHKKVSIKIGSTSQDKKVLILNKSVHVRMSI